MSTLGERIAKARTGAGLKQEDLVAVCSVSTAQAVSNWENGKSAPKARDLVAIAKATGVSLKWLVDGIEFPGHGATVTPENVLGVVVPRVDFEDVPAFLKGDRTQIKAYIRSAFPCGNNAFATLINDRSLEPDLKIGYSAITDPDQAPRPGELCMVLMGSDLMIRRYRPRGAEVELAPINPDFETIRVTNFADILVGAVTEWTAPRGL